MWPTQPLAQWPGRAVACTSTIHINRRRRPTSKRCVCALLERIYISPSQSRERPTPLKKPLVSAQSFVIDIQQVELLLRIDSFTCPSGSCVRRWWWWWWCLWNSLAQSYDGALCLYGSSTCAAFSANRRSSSKWLANH